MACVARRQCAREHVNKAIRQLLPCKICILLLVQKRSRECFQSEVVSKDTSEALQIDGHLSRLQPRLQTWTGCTTRTCGHIAPHKKGQYTQTSPWIAGEPAFHTVERGMPVPAPSEVSWREGYRKAAPRGAFIHMISFGPRAHSFRFLTPGQSATCDRAAFIQVQRTCCSSQLGRESASKQQILTLSISKHRPNRLLLFQKVVRAYEEQCTRILALN